MGSETSNGPRWRVLVVEDDPMVRRIVREALEGDGYEVGETPFGVGVAKRAQAFRPHLVLLDYNLPDARGTDVLASIRSLPATARIPVVAFTGQYGDAAGARAALPGFDGHLTKPMNLIDLLRLVRSLREATPRAPG